MYTLTIEQAGCPRSSRQWRKKNWMIRYQVKAVPTMNAPPVWGVPTQSDFWGVVSRV
ncbi:hypothetical protein [Xenorhabdus bovienii]|uniref:hypothetical protein n=1 Tax=Xenorhabdus bovienii TaxID=40576 RepID=UPI0012D2D58D|nr:hypothetical protein [Xenorhabdus bovienii]